MVQHVYSSFNIVTRLAKLPCKKTSFFLNFERCDVSQVILEVQTVYCNFGMKVDMMLN